MQLAGLTASVASSATLVDRAAKEKVWTGGDDQNCSLPDVSTGNYGRNCTKWDPSGWQAAVKPLAALIRANNPSGVPGVNFMGGIHPRLKRPVGRRLAVAAAALLAKKIPLTGPTISGCRHTTSKGNGTGSLTLQFNLTLLGTDDVVVRQFNNDMSSWSGVDSLTAMICASTPPPAPNGSLSCQSKCEAAGHCATGLISCDQLPSCGQVSCQPASSSGKGLNMTYIERMRQQERGRLFA